MWRLLVVVAASLCTFTSNVPYVVGLSTLTPRERAALVDLYVSTDGDQWVGNDGWMNYADDSNDPCVEQWLGVNCSTTNPAHVV